MASQEFLKLLNDFENNPSRTLIEWQRQLNHIFNNIANGNYTTTVATSVSILDIAGLYAALTVEAALAEAATNIATNLTRLINAENATLGGYVRVTNVNNTASLTPAYFGVIICNSASPITLNLPTAIAYKGYGFIVNNVGAGTVTIDPNGTETLQGNATVAVTTNNICRFTSDNSNWYYA